MYNVRMLSAIRRSDNKKVLAREEAKSNQPFFCPECNDDTILKKGRIKAHHFAHKPPVTCEYGLGETEQHRRCKMEIYDGLVCHSRFANCEIERGMGTVRPDIYACMDGIQIAIEVQLSTLTLDNIIYRTSEYAKKGIYVLWLSIYTDALKNDKYSPRLWERWVHAASFGRVYYWIGGLDMVPIHFDDYQLRIEEHSWSDRNGLHWIPGHDKLSKRYKTPNHGRRVNICDSLIPKHRLEPLSGRIPIPQARLLIAPQREGCPGAPATLLFVGAGE